MLTCVFDVRFGASEALIAIIAYLMVEMGKTQDRIQSDTSLEKESYNHTVLRILKLHSTDFCMLLETRMVTLFDLYHCYIY